MGERQRMYINGGFCDAASGATVAVLDPATDEAVTEVPFGDARDAARAVSCATEALKLWRNVNAWERGAVLRRAAELMRERVEAIALAMSREVGKPLGEARGETLASAAQFEWFAEEGKRAYGRWVPPGKDGVRRWVLKQPVGVCATITAWNFPLLLPARKIAAATGAGCTVVSRPSQQAPLAVMEMFGCLHDAGFPPGVVNLVLGPSSALAEVFLGSPSCRKISFTGSTEVGRELMRGAASQLKRLSLELGGSAPVLIFPDCDVADVARRTVQGRFRNNGQVCIAATRFFVHESIYEEYVARVLEHVAALRLGNPLEQGVDCGPLFNAEAVEHMEQLVADAVAGGARIAAGGKRPQGPEFARGQWFEPTVILGLPPTARLTCEEIFGPIMPIIPFATTEEAVALANDTEYGLAAYLFTRDLTRAIEVTEALECGIVGLNDMTPATAECPFGGTKQSGFGREGGSEGIEDYLETKYVSIGMS